MTERADGYDPFRTADPPVLVHDVSSADFERAWKGVEPEGEHEMPCPICRNGKPADRGVAPLDERGWVRFSCGDIVAKEHTPG